MKHICSALKRNGEGFTLVELIVVIAILAILAAVAYPVYTGYIDYTNKGVDRQTVGEINHALELANYSDPSIFDSPVTVYLADNGIICADPDVASALEDAFGDLSATKLTYLKWKGGMNAARLTSIADSLGGADSYVKKYWDSGKTASFAGNINELWGDVEFLLDLYNTGDPNPTNLHQVIGSALDKSSNYSFTVYEIDEAGNVIEDASGNPVQVTVSGSAQDIIYNSWLSDEGSGALKVLQQDETFKSSFGTSVGSAAYVAQCCAFKKYLEGRTDLTPEQKAQADAYDPVPKVKGTLPQYYTEYFLNVDGMDEVIKEYREGQAQIDAMAYIGLMEAAGEVEKDMGGTPTDDELFDAITGYVGMTESVMESEKNWNTAKDALKDSNTAVYATVRKTANGLDIKWNPPEVEPDIKSEESGGESGPACSETNHTGASKDFRISKTGESGTIVLCSKDPTYKSCTVSINISGSPVTQTITGTVTSGSDKVEYNNGVIAVKNGATGGSATVVLNWTVETSGIFGSQKTEYTFTVNVTIH